MDSRRGIADSGEGEAPAELFPAARSRDGLGRSLALPVNHNVGTRRAGEGEPPGEPSLRAPTPKRRKHPAHGVFINPDLPTIVFVTVCTKNRCPWLVSPNVHELLRSVWRDAASWRVGRYVIMPDHLHFFAAPVQAEIGLDRWIRYWKSQFSRRHGQPIHRWQTDHWDTRLRRGESYSEKWAYVRENPVRHGLVKRAEEWPYQGELFVLPW